MEREGEWRVRKRGFERPSVTTLVEGGRAHDGNTWYPYPSLSASSSNTPEALKEEEEGKEVEKRDNNEN